MKNKKNFFQYQFFYMVIVTNILLSCQGLNESKPSDPNNNENTRISLVNLELPWVALHSDLIDFISNHNSNDFCNELIILKDEQKFPKVYVDSFLKKHIDYLNSEFKEDFKISNFDYKLCEVPAIWMKDTFQFDSVPNKHSCEGLLYHCIESRNKDFIFAFMRIPKLKRVYFCMYAKTIHGNWKLVSLGFPKDSDFNR